MSLSWWNRLVMQRMSRAARRARSLAWRPRPTVQTLTVELLEDRTLPAGLLPPLLTNPLQPSGPARAVDTDSVAAFPVLGGDDAGAAQSVTFTGPAAPLPAAAAAPDAGAPLGALAATGLDTHALGGTGADNFAGQVVFLELRGAQGIRYDGPVPVAGIDVTAFQAPRPLRGQEGAVAAALLAALQQDFAGTGVTFTTERPQGGNYSTVYVGGNGAAFAPYGLFLGVAEKVDAGNRDPNDEAFVFSDLVAPAATADDYGRALAAVTAHEVGHLLGLAHDHDHEGHGAAEAPLDDVAYKPFTHIEIALDVRHDLLDDGMLTIDGHDYPVNPRIVEAIRQYPAFYYGGAGDDAFPDIVMAQQILHPASTGIWISHLLDKAWQAQLPDSPYSPSEQLQILAWSYAFATHGAGDIWAHTLVNEFTDGVFPDFGNYTDLTNPLARLNAIRHLMLEGYANDAAPAFDGIKKVNDEVVRERLPDGDVDENTTAPRPMDAPHAFLYDAFIRDLPDLPGHTEKLLFHVTTNVAARAAELDAAGAIPVGSPGNAVADPLRALFASPPPEGTDISSTTTTPFIL